MNRDELTKSQRWQLADMLAKERLPEVNAASAEPHPRTKTVYVVFVKRLLDILISLIAIIITLPINIVIFIITLFDVGRPVFFMQDRVGRNGKTFRIVKFRNMTNEKDGNGDLLPAAQRVTKFGKFMRKTSLDELLNFYSVLKGDMSIIGPRPLVPEYLVRYSDRHKARLALRPGLECPPREIGTHVWTWQEQFENDVWYVENVSFRTDCKMLINLVRFALDKKSANARATAKRGTFMGYGPEGIAINLEQIPEEEFQDFLKSKGLN